MRRRFQRAQAMPVDVIDPATLPRCERCGQAKRDVYDRRPFSALGLCACAHARPWPWYGDKVRAKFNDDVGSRAFEGYEVVSVDREVRPGLDERWCQLRKGDHHIRMPLSTIERDPG